MKASSFYLFLASDMNPSDWIVFAVCMMTLCVVWIGSHLFKCRVKLGFMGVKLSMLSIAKLYLKRLPVNPIMSCLTAASQTGLNVSYEDLIKHHQNGGNLDMVERAIYIVAKVPLNLDFNQICELDLKCKGTGKTLLDLLKTIVEKDKP